MKSEKASTYHLKPNTLQVTTQQLEYLVAACEADTWKLAATRLGVSLSALSQGLLELERRTSIPLFQTNGRRKTLNPEATEVYDYAKRVITQTRDLSAWLSSWQKGTQGHLRIGMIDVAAVKHFPQQLKLFKHQRPDVELHISVAPSALLLSQLRSGEISLAVLVDPPETPDDLSLLPLLKEEIAIYAPADGELDHKSWGPWVGFPKGSHTRALTAKALQQRNIEYDVIAESHQPEVLKEMVNLGMGWTVLPSSQVEGPLNTLRRAQKKPLFYRHLVAARRKQTSPNPLTEQLIQTLVR